MNFPIFVLCSAILIHSFDTAVTQNDFWGRFCGDENYTQDSAYQQDLDDVLYTLTGTNNGFGFFNSTSGQANAAALCRGDVEPESCRRCVDDATRRLRQVCPNQVQAIGWYDLCFLKYSNQTSLVNLRGTSRFSAINISESRFYQWNQSIVNLLGVLRPEAVGGGQLRKYTVGNISIGDFETMYGMMQCIPDLSATECDNCFAEAVDFSRLFARRAGVRVYHPNCNIRYESYRFFNSTWFPAPPAPAPAPPAPIPTVTPSSKSTSLGVIVGPILVAIALILVVVVFFILRRRRKQKRKGSLLPEGQVGFNDSSSEGSKHQREDDDTGEMSYFNLGTIQVATNNFSLENKLGEGGFGPVYKGKLQDGKEIAVKRLSTNSGQGIVEFKTEVRLIIKLQHKNLVRLLGYCVKGSERLLIYEFMANNSLDTFLFGPYLLSFTTISCSICKYILGK